MSVTAGGKGQEKIEQPEKKSKVGIERAERSKPKERNVGINLEHYYSVKPEYYVSNPGQEKALTLLFFIMAGLSLDLCFKNE